MLCIGLQFNSSISSNNNNSNKKQKREQQQEKKAQKDNVPRCVLAFVSAWTARNPQPVPSLFPSLSL